MGEAVHTQEQMARNEVASQPAAAVAEPAGADRTEKIWWSISLALGLLSLWFVKYVIYSDGISYLEIASQYRSGNWGDAVNSYWSPLYSWVLAISGWALRPSATWEVPTLHLVNFLAFAGSLFTFRFFLRRLECLVMERGGLRSSRERRAWVSAAYAVFLWSGLVLTPPELVTPDAITNLLLYGIAGIVIRIWRENGGARQFATLGLLLGICYLTRAAFFIAPAFFLATLLCSVRPVRRTARNCVITACVFGAVSAPWVLAISRKAGHWTAGESGKLNYAWEVRGMTRSIHWQGGSPQDGRPLHPTRQLMDKPAVFEFAWPIHATYAPWYDPSWWYAGINPKFNFADQVKALAVNLRLAVATVLVAPGFLWALWNISMSRQRKIVRASLLRLWWCWTPPLCLIGGYALVFIDTRYIASAAAIVVLTIVGAGFSCSLTVPSARAASRIATLTCVSFFVYPVLVQLYSLINDWRHGREMYPNTQYETSRELAELGLQRGTKIAYIGNGMNADWSRLLGTPIVADIPVRFERDHGLFLDVIVNRKEIESYWRAAPETKQKVLDLLRAAGARAVVADLVPSWADTTGWVRLSTQIYKREGNGATYLRFLKSPPKPTGGATR
jgi:hypothetical protein